MGLTVYIGYLGVYCHVAKVIYHNVTGYGEFKTERAVGAGLDIIGRDTDIAGLIGHTENMAVEIVYSGIPLHTGAVHGYSGE